MLLLCATFILCDIKNEINFYVPGLLDDCQGLGGCHRLHHEEGLGYLVRIPIGLQRVPLDGSLCGVGVFTVE